MQWSKFWPTLIPVVGLLVEAFSGQISGWLAGHPQLSLLLVALVTAAANVVKSPRL
jgi:hypothetical protein